MTFSWMKVYFIPRNVGMSNILNDLRGNYIKSNCNNNKFTWIIYRLEVNQILLVHWTVIQSRFKIWMFMLFIWSFDKYLLTLRN